jgi:hypothetical protein
MTLSFYVSNQLPALPLTLALGVKNRETLPPPWPYSAFDRLMAIGCVGAKRMGSTESTEPYFSSAEVTMRWSPVIDCRIVFPVKGGKGHDIFDMPGSGLRVGESRKLRDFCLVCFMSTSYIRSRCGIFDSDVETKLLL